MLDITKIIEGGGLLLISLIVFAESGLLVGFFLPGDTLLFSAGFFASQGRLSLILLLILVVIAAIIGDNTGYTIGKHGGKRIFKKQDGLLFRAEYLTRAEKFYEKHGGKTIVLARFVPIVRTFAPVVAGAGSMPQKKFFMFNIVGATIWGLGVPLTGYFLGSRIPNIDHYLLPAVGVATVLTFGPPIIHVLTDQKIRAALLQKIKSKNRAD